MRLTIHYMDLSSFFGDRLFIPIRANPSAAVARPAIFVDLRTCSIARCAIPHTVCTGQITERAQYRPLVHEFNAIVPSIASITAQTELDSKRICRERCAVAAYVF